jgi:hypothetical protein
VTAAGAVLASMADSNSLRYFDPTEAALGGGWNCRARALRSLPACFGLAKVPSSDSRRYVDSSEAASGSTESPSHISFGMIPRPVRRSPSNCRSERNVAVCTAGVWSGRVRAMGTLGFLGLTGVPALACRAGAGARSAPRAGFSAVSFRCAATPATTAAQSQLHPADSELALALASRAASEARLAAAAAAAFVTFLAERAAAAVDAAQIWSRVSMLAAMAPRLSSLFSSCHNLGPSSLTTVVVTGSGRSVPISAVGAALADSVTVASPGPCALYWLRVFPSRIALRLSPLAPPLFNPHT